MTNREYILSKRGEDEIGLLGLEMWSYRVRLVGRVDYDSFINEDVNEDVCAIVEAHDDDYNRRMEDHLAAVAEYERLKPRLVRPNRWAGRSLYDFRCAK